MNGLSVWRILGMSLSSLVRPTTHVYVWRACFFYLRRIQSINKRGLMMALWCITWTNSKGTLLSIYKTKVRFLYRNTVQRLKKPHRSYGNSASFSKTLKGCGCFPEQYRFHILKYALSRFLTWMNIHKKTYEALKKKIPF